MSTLVVEEKLRSIQKLISELQQNPMKVFSSKEIMDAHTIIFNICISSDYCPQLYSKYCESAEHYIITTGLPWLRKTQQKDDDTFLLLIELVKTWETHERVVRMLNMIFQHLDKYWIPRRNKLPLEEVGVACFRNLVYEEFKDKVKDVVIALIRRGREGENVDWVLLNKSIDIITNMEREEDIEVVLLEETVNYYSKKASEWIEDYCLATYVGKLEESLNRERRIVSPCVCKLVRKTEEILLNELLNKEESSNTCCKLFIDDKVMDPSEILKLFCRIPQGLERFSNLFKRHVQEQSKALAKQVRHARKPKNVFLQRLKALHERYRLRVADCYWNSPLLEKALEDAFHEIYNDKDVILALME